MRVLLIDPPFKRFTGFVNFYFPVGLAYLAAALKANHEVAIYDADAVQKGTNIDFSDEYAKLELYRQAINDNANPAWSDIRNVLDQVRPDVVGITAMTTKFGSVLKTAEVVKRHSPRCTVVAGGPHATFLPELTLKCDYIDFVVRGEGERAFPPLLGALEKRDGFDLVPGLCWRKDTGVHCNDAAEFVENLDNLSFPARSLLMNHDCYSSEDMGVIMTSRGCPYKCSYCCHMWMRKVRNRSAANVIAEIQETTRTYGTRQFEFKDDSFSVNRTRVIGLCDAIVSSRLNISWGCTTRVDLLDEELVIKMKAAGCNVVKLGIETGSEHILEETHKGVTFEQMRRVAKLLNRHDLFWSGYFMMGLPMETEVDIRLTHDFMKELNPHYAGLGIYNPFPKTELFEQGVEMGLLHADVELDHFFKRNPKDYFFVDPSRRVKAIDGERFDELATAMTEAFHRHNTRLGSVIRRGWARRKVYSRDIRLLASDTKKAVKWLTGGRV